MARSSQVERKTKETGIRIKLNLDGKGNSRIRTGTAFFDHMLELFSRHGYFDLEVNAKGDLEIDPHHTVEDTGIVLGQAFNEALGDRRKIHRYGSAFLPMDDTLVSCHIDLGGRPYLVYQNFIDGPVAAQGFNASLFCDFFQAFATHARANVHLTHQYGRAGKKSDLHHMYEAAFKAFGRALDEATRPEPRSPGVVSTKGRL